ncbi:hypothetical protein BC834DRAFT_970004 [Gloeopeniophorella convolvens]|nr:hypothetical protein BC834DRAFT_970004 [Gloeopeniophorella convolvens]
MPTPSFISELTSTVSSAAAISTSTAVEPMGKIAWQTGVYLVVVAAVVAIIAGIIISVGRAEWKNPMSSLTVLERNKYSWLICPPSAFELVRRMLHFFSTTFLPMFSRLGRGTAAAAIQPHRPPQPQSILPSFRSSGFTAPLVMAAPRPAMLRDSSSFRVPTNPYSDSSSSPQTPRPTAFVDTIR